MKAQYPSALEKQCSKHSTQLGARTKPECVNTNLLRSPGPFLHKGTALGTSRASTEEGLAPLNCCLRALLWFRKLKKKTPSQIGLDRRGQKKQ